MSPEKSWANGRKTIIMENYTEFRLSEILIYIPSVDRINDVK